MRHRTVIRPHPPTSSPQGREGANQNPLSPGVRGLGGESTCRSFLILLAFLLAGVAGCRESYLPPSVGSPGSPLSSGQYPLRVDLMVGGKTGLDGAPKRWPSPGFPPLLSARFPQSTPDLDIADELRKQLGKIVLDPTTKLEPSQNQAIAILLEAAFGIPLEPRVSIPDWDSIKAAAVARPDPKKGAFENIGAYLTAIKNWEESARWKGDWISANNVKAELRLDDSTLA